jgi:hypothetical protein
MKRTFLLWQNRTLSFWDYTQPGSLCQPNLEMSSFSKSRNVRFRFRSPPSVRLVLAAIVCATDGSVSA